MVRKNERWAGAVLCIIKQHTKDCGNDVVRRGWLMIDYGGKMETCTGVWRPVGRKADVEAVTIAQKRNKIFTAWSQ